MPVAVIELYHLVSLLEKKVLLAKSLQLLAPLGISTTAGHFLTSGHSVPGQLARVMEG